MSNNDNITFEIDNDEEDVEDKVNNLEKLIQEQGSISFDPLCVRKKSNWSKSLNIYKFDNEQFSKETLLADIPTHSPKLDILLKKIDELDKQDKKKHGKLFKHFIFSDLKVGTYGARLLAGALIAKGMHMGYSAQLKPNQPNAQNVSNKKAKRYDKITFLTDDELLENKGNNFYLLSSVAVYDQSVTAIMKKNILQKFNQRPDNVHGDLARIIVMDSGFKEGIDLFDIKYIHMFEPSTVASDQKQVIGRGTRTCGQKGLIFHPTQGWPLDVFVYDLSIPDKLAGSFLGVKTTIELYLKAMNLDIRLFHFAHELEKTTIIGSVDYELNKNIHLFSIDANADEDLEEDLDEDAEYIYGGSENGVGDFEDKPPNKITNLKRKLVLRRKDPVIIINTQQITPDNNPTLGFEEMRTHIREQYSDFKWDVVKMENLCQEKQSGGSGELIKYTPTQDFIRHYFTPAAPIKGLLLYHSVGTGKTCSAIATATSSFEKQGYTILWVTRTTLKNDIWKNMFDQVCNDNIRSKITNDDLKIPDEQNKRMRLLSKSWRIRPMSYKQFSNLVSKQNAFYKTLVKVNGEADPLKKTLLIIDEAHKLYGSSDDLSSLERPDMKAFHRAIMNSYLLSGRDSVKLLLMTATPITKNPMELISLINLCKPMNQQMPTEFNEFSDKYLNDIGEFTESGRIAYLDEIAGYVSYLNREKDARQFAQPIIENISVPITDDVATAERFDKKIVRDLMDSNVIDLKERILENSKKIEGELGDLDKNKFNFLKKEACEGFDGAELHQCEKIVNNNIKLLVNEAKNEVKRIRANINETRQLIKDKNVANKKILSTIKENTENYADEYDKYKGSLLHSIKNSCSIKISGNSSLKEQIGEHPVIQKYDRELAEYNKQIQDLHAHLKTDLVIYKSKIDNLKKILKTDLNELERSVINMTIRDARKTQRNVMKLKRNDVAKTEKGILESIQKTEKKRKLRYNNVRKTVKQMIITEKRNARDILKQKKTLRKALRNQNDYKEEIKHELLKGLVDKYKGKIADDISQDADEYEKYLKEREAEKERKLKEREAERERKLKEREAERAQKSKEQEHKRTQRANDRERKKNELETNRAIKSAAKELARKTRKNKKNSKLE